MWPHPVLWIFAVVVFILAIAALLALLGVVSRDAFRSRQEQTPVVGDDDWRLQGQEANLQGITLRRMPYFRWSDTWDHDHCEFCWAEFMTPEDTPPDYEEPVQHEGYATEGIEGQRDHYSWICVECFEDFKDRFKWRVAE